MAERKSAERTGMRRRLRRWQARAVHQLLRLWWYVTRPVTFGVRALPVTPDGRVVLVRHSYVAGWHLPGGGRKPNEDGRAAVIRELREEIGLRHHGAVRLIEEFFHRPNHKRDTVSLFVVEDVVFAPSLSLEIEAIAAFAPDALPDGTTARTREQIARWLPHAWRTD